MDKNARHPEPRPDNELAVLDGAKPGTAIRLASCGSVDQHGVRLEQLAYSPALGWYVQKTFCVPRHLLAALATELRKADCLLPRPSPVDREAPLLRIGPDTPPLRLQRKDA
jgi:hypothetical protein